jgi:hypothetical protein
MDLYIATPTHVSRQEYKKNFGNINNSLWNVAVGNAPYRTGNLRLNIKKSNVSLNKVIYVYDDLEAAYVNFLEEGIGRNKRHIGFIEIKTVSSMLLEIDAFFSTGKVSYTGIPSVLPRTDKLRNYERKMAKALGYGVDSRINASERANLSFNFKKGNKRKKTNNNLYKNISSPVNTDVQKSKINRK